MTEQNQGSKDSVIAIIKGGLGNQLFIYAAARSFALRTGRGLFLDIIRGFQRDGYGRQYRLDRFPIASLIMPEKWRIAPTLRHPRHKLIRALSKFLPRNWLSYVSQRWNLPPGQLTDLKPRRKRITLNGYWADEAFFADYSETIRAELSPPVPTDPRNRELGEELKKGETIFIHARRVRYPTLLSKEYYRTALEDILKKVANPKFVVFSDDPDWTRENIDFGNSPVQWVEHNADDELADIWLMSCCRHAIMANSSFSWWGAWLGGDPSEGRLIYTPVNPDWVIRPAKGWHHIHFEM